MSSALLGYDTSSVQKVSMISDFQSMIVNGRTVGHYYGLVEESIQYDVLDAVWIRAAHHTAGYTIDKNGALIQRQYSNATALPISESCVGNVKDLGIMLDVDFYIDADGKVTKTPFDSTGSDHDKPRYTLFSEHLKSLCYK